MANIDKPNLKKNVLHGFDTFNTIFTISGLNEKEMSSHAFLKTPVHDIIARTGGIGENAKVTDREFGEPDQDENTPLEIEGRKSRYQKQYGDSINILNRAHDLFIENVNMISTVGPNNERSLGNFTKMEFEVHEPFGITFIEKVRAATAINGYVDYQDAPLLLTIEFVGNHAGGKGDGEPVIYNEDTGKTIAPVIKKIPILIARVDFDVNEGGAKYQVVAVPYTDMAFDDRYKYPRTSASTQADDIDEWIVKTQRAFFEQMIKERDEDKTREFVDQYQFLIDDKVRTAAQKYFKSPIESTNLAGDVQDTFPGDSNELLNSAGTPLTDTAIISPKSSGSDLNENISVTKYFEDAIRSSLGYQQLANNFWTSYLRGTGKVDEAILKDEDATIAYLQSTAFKDVLMENQYVEWFKIKTTVETPDPSKIDKITKMSPKKIIYQALPFRIHILKFMPPGASLGKIDWSKKVHKEYNFIYTGDNVDVQNLRINYKTAYYMRNTRAEDKSRTEKGFFKTLAAPFLEAFGTERDPEPLLPLRQYPSTIKGKNTTQTLSDQDNKAQQFYDYLTHPEVDMMRIELDILGDPDYLCQDMYVPIHRDGETKPLDDADQIIGKGGFNADSFQPIINIRYRLPDDINENEGTMFSEGIDGQKLFRDENLFFNGLYQVNKIESRFDNGQFLQTLYCSRFNNQQGEGAPVQLLESANSKLYEYKKSVDLKSKEKIKEAAQDALRKNLSETAGVNVNVDL